MRCSLMNFHIHLPLYIHNSSLFLYEDLCDTLTLFHQCNEWTIATYSCGSFRMVNILKYVLLSHYVNACSSIITGRKWISSLHSIFKLVIYELVLGFMGLFSYCQAESNSWTSQHAYTLVFPPDLEKFDETFGPIKVKGSNQPLCWAYVGFQLPRQNQIIEDVLRLDFQYQYT